MGNPISLVDPDGMEPEPPTVRLYTETGGVGHTFVTVGSGDNTTVYTYGRYGELGKDKPSARSTTPTGEGVMIKLSGTDATEYISHAITNDNAEAFEITDANGDQVSEFLDGQMDASTKTPGVGKYANDERAKVVDTYNLSSNNCTTKSCDAVIAGGSEATRTAIGNFNGTGIITLDHPTTPGGLQGQLGLSSAKSNSNVRRVTSEVKKELNIRDSSGGGSGGWD